MSDDLNMLESPGFARAFDTECLDENDGSAALGLQGP